MDVFILGFYNNNVVSNRTDIQISKEIMSFCIIGIISTIINYSSFCFFLEVLKAPYIFSSWAGYLIGLFIGFLLNVNYTFNFRNNLSINLLVKYIFIYIISLILSTGLLVLLTELFKLDPKVSNIFAIIQSTFTNFLGCKFYVFNNTVKKSNEIISIKQIFLSKLCLIIFILKIVFSFFFASYYMKELFTPFINWFVEEGFKNPWEYFYSINSLKMFPYPTVMLWIMAVPRIIFDGLVSSDWNLATPIHIFLMRIPLLVSDLILFYIFLKLFPLKRTIVLYIYWCSPIIFYVNYIHGQLDIIPTLILFSSMLLLIEKKYLLSCLLLSLAAATKNHIFVFVPFYFIFLYRQRLTTSKLFFYLFQFLFVYIILILPYFSKGFVNLIFKAPEQETIYEFVLQVSKSLKILICPTAVFLLFMKFCSYKKLNKEIFMMFTGILFTFLVVFTTPMPGWFIWSLPFLIYFYINNKEFSRLPFISYNFIYLVYFTLFFEKSDSLFKEYLGVSTINNLSLSLMLSSVAFTAIWMYQTGIRENEKLKLKEKPILIGIGGNSGTGKHTLYEILKTLLGEKNCIPVFGDNFHKWERGNQNLEIYTPLNPAANKLHEEVEKAIALKEGNEIELVEYDHRIGQFTNPIKLESTKFVFFVGLHPFYLKRMRELIDIKIFLDTDEELRKLWKVKRDSMKRGYEPQNVLKQISKRIEDGEKYIKPQKEFVDLTIKYLPESNVDFEAVEVGNIKIKIKYIVDNSVNLEELVDQSRSIKSLRVELYMSNDLIHQELDVSGLISSEDVLLLAQRLNLNLDELLITKPIWLDNFDGITQLVFLLIYNEVMKVK